MLVLTHIAHTPASPLQRPTVTLWVVCEPQKMKTKTRSFSHLTNEQHCLLFVPLLATSLKQAHAYQKSRCTSSTSANWIFHITDVEDSLGYLI
jgi:hypothetical protein